MMLSIEQELQGNNLMNNMNDYTIMKQHQQRLEEVERASRHAHKVEQLRKPSPTVKNPLHRLFLLLLSWIR
jgi:hypothetical protein